MGVLLFLDQQILLIRMQGRLPTCCILAEWHEGLLVRWHNTKGGVQVQLHNLG
jgi:hypothetical protein